jgi:hypothetical protein
LSYILVLDQIQTTFKIDLRQVPHGWCQVWEVRFDHEERFSALAAANQDDAMDASTDLSDRSKAAAYRSSLPAVVAATESGRVGLVRWNAPDGSSGSGGLLSGCTLLMHAENSAVNTFDIDAASGQVRRTFRAICCGFMGTVHLIQ